MDHLCWIIVLILISVFKSEEGAEHHRYRSRARHILVRNLGIRSTTIGTNSPTQTTTFDRPSTVTTTTQEPSLTSTRYYVPDENDQSTGRRGSQPPDSYTEGEWELIQQQMGNPPPSSNSDSDENQDSNSDDHRQQQQGGQDSPSTQRPEGESQGQGNQNPFLNRMSAMDYLTRRAHGNILHSRNNQQKREFSREMGEQMCEAFGKHYVTISIGGKCV